MCSNSFSYRLLNSSYSPTAITPLQFVKKTGAVVISAEEKHRQFEDLEHLRQDSYKRAEHFAAALTQLFPQLISFIIDKQLTSKLVSSKELRGMVAATY